MLTSRTVCACTTSGSPLTWAFKDERDSVPIVGSSEGDGVIIACTLEDLVHAVQDREEEITVVCFKEVREGSLAVSTVCCYLVCNAMTPTPVHIL